MERTSLLELIKYINPAELDYQDWVNVGMALKYEGYTVSDWEEWSKQDYGRYNAGECARKWTTFHGNASPVTGGTIFQMAVENGWMPEQGHELAWDDTIQTDSDRVVVDAKWIEGREVTVPDKWNPVQQLIQYLEVLFESGENVGYVTKSWKTEKGKYVPQDKGNWDRTAGQLIEALSKCEGDIGSVLGDSDPQGGAWIRFNPLDGKGVRNDNVTDFRYALVESDNMEIEKQNAIYRELELPIACLVHSGGKSLHAIVKIDAADYSEYRKRVDYLYDVCQKNGLKVDTQNRNPSRLSRMPGILRGDQKQFLVDTNIGKESWNEWHDWIESINDDLPEPEKLEDVWDNLPDLAPCLIDGILRQGHKMLIAGPSKAGKSFLLIELCIAIAEGVKWLNWNCSQGRVLYVNLELDRASCLHRFKDVYTSLGIQPNNLENLDIWNLRGKSLPMDKLAPKLIRRAAKKNYIAIVIDPIYKIITGDENSADQMAAFCNQFDKVCTELSCAVIYCHHHSKGSQGSKKSMDRASGSGVFARDPDAILDLIELDITKELKEQQENSKICEICKEYLEEYMDKRFNMYEDLSQDDMCSKVRMQDYCENRLDKWQHNALHKKIDQEINNLNSKTAWRIEGTLREFPKFEPVNSWFDYPVHRLDDIGCLKDIKPEAEKMTYKKNFSNKKTAAELKQDRKNSIEITFQGCEENGIATIKQMAEQSGASEDTVRRHLKEHGGFWIQKGEVGRKVTKN